jgi:hypothetical protein
MENNLPALERHHFFVQIMTPERCGFVHLVVSVSIAVYPDLVGSNSDPEYFADPAPDQIQIRSLIRQNNLALFYI